MPSSGTGPFWSVIVPAERTNLIVNPSFEFGTANYVVLGAAGIGTVSGTSVAGAWSLRVNGAGAGSLGNDRGVVYGTANGLDVNGTYVLSAYVYTTGGTVALYAGTDNTVAGGNYAVASGTQSGWFRLTTPGFKPTGGSVFPKVVAFGTAMRGTIYVDAVQLEKGTPVTTYIDGDQPGCSWNGLPQASTSSRSGDTRLGGQAVRFDDIGFTVDTSPGIGAPPFNTLSQSYAQLDGGEFQKQRKNVRRFTLTSLVDGTSWGDLHYQRRRLIEAIRIENTPTQQPMRLLYSGAGGTLAIDAVWDGGVQFGADGQSFAEGVVASFTAYDPDWKDTLQDGTTLGDHEVFTGGRLLYRSPIGKWGTVGPNNTFFRSGADAFNESLDGGTLLFVGEINIDAGIRNGLVWVAGSTYGTYGNGTISGGAYDLTWDFDRSRLFIMGGFGTAGGTTTGNWCFWIPATNTFGSLGFIGTGVSISGGAAEAPLAYKILPWDIGTYYIAGGPFYRINGVLLGSNWNLLRWDGQLGGWSAAPPVSTTGTGFIKNEFFIGFGSSTGRVVDLEFFDRTRFIITAEANTLRGFGTGITTALYDVRGTWGTIPGFRIPMNVSLPFANDAYKAQDQSVYVGYNGSSSLGTTALKIQGLTASGLGTISTGGVNHLAADDDTVAWYTGFYFKINNQDYPHMLVRTNGYDYQPPDILTNEADSWSANAIFRSQTGTHYVRVNNSGITNGTAASLGTIVNRGMSNVYPTLRIRNTSTGTVNIFQWANMTTKEYAWFSLTMLGGETVTLTTGPGRVAFQSTYRGNIIEDVVGGSKLASWHLVPGQNIVSFLADNPAVTADMYWNPRYHSADGTGIV